jgi:hypothetical protein
MIQHASLPVHDPAARRVSQEVPTQARALASQIPAVLVPPLTDSSLRLVHDPLPLPLHPHASRPVAELLIVKPSSRLYMCMVEQINGFVRRPLTAGAPWPPSSAQVRAASLFTYPIRASPQPQPTFVPLRLWLFVSQIVFLQREVLDGYARGWGPPNTAVFLCKSRSVDHHRSPAMWVCVVCLLGGIRRLSAQICSSLQSEGEENLHRRARELFLWEME